MSDRLIGFRLERFKLERHLGRGTFGEVYLAHDGTTGRRVSLKLLAPAEPAESQEGFRRELDVLRRMNHPLVPPVVDAGEVGGRPFVALGYVEGSTLRELTEGKRMDGVRLAGLGSDLASILAYVHQAGLMHGDLKPENVVVDVEGRAHLIDFGLARGKDLPPLPRGAGTPRYLAPEQLRGEEPDARADLYQLGLLLYECAAGRPAYSGHKSAEERLEARRQPPARVVGLEPAIMDLVLDLLGFEPGSRPAHALAVAGRLNALRAARLALPAGPPDLPAAAEAAPPLPEDPPPVPASGPSGPLVLSGSALVPRPDLPPPVEPPLATAGLVQAWLAGALAQLVVYGFGGKPPTSLLTLLPVLALLITALEPVRRYRRAASRLAVAGWGAAWVRLAGLVAFAVLRPGKDPLELLLGGIPLAAGAVLLGIPLAVFLLNLLTADRITRLAEPELGPPLLGEVAAPGLGHALQGEWKISRGLGVLALLTASFVDAALQIAALVPMAIGSLAAVAIRGFSLLSAREEDEARLLGEILDSSPEKVRCQAGMALLTAALAGALRRQEWAPPALNRGRGPLVGKAVKELAGTIVDAQPCLAGERLSLLASGGEVHLFCERHDMCPSPLPKPVDRTAGTQMDGASSASDQTVINPEPKE